MHPTVGRPITIVTVVAVLFLGLLLRFSFIIVKPGITKDEANTLVFATGHNLSYGAMIATESAPLLVKARTFDWRKFMETDDNKGLKDVFKDSSADVHSPLFYLLLHMWMLLTGSSLFGARLLNVIIDLLAALLFVGIAKDLFGQRYALAALLFYAVSPGFFLVSGEIRSYALLGFWNVAAFWATWRIIGAPAKRYWWIVWGFANACGIYTHYIFALTFLPLNLCMAILYLRRGDYLKLRQQGVAILSVLLALLPLGLIVLKQVEVAHNIGWTGAWMVDKNLPATLIWAFSDTTTGAFKGFLFALPQPAALFLLAAVLSIIVYGVLNADRMEAKLLIGSLLFSTWIGYGILYFFGFLPSHAIGAKYQILAVPYLLLGLTYGLKSLKRPWQKGFCISIIPIIMLSGSIRLTYGALQNKGSTINPISVARYIPYNSLVILDNTFSGLVLPVVLSLMPDQQMLVASQSKLAQDANRLPEVIDNEKSIVYMSNSTLNSGFTEKGHEQILENLQRNFGLDSSSGLPLPVATLGCAGCGKGFQIYIFSRRFE